MSATNTNMNPKPTLLGVPAEIRNGFWMFSFAVDKDESVPLRSTRPPIKELLLVNHQIYNEAVQFFREANRNYWAQTDFYIARFHDPASLNFALSQKQLAQIQHLELSGLQLDRAQGYGNVLAKATRIYGGWRVKLSNSSTDTFCGASLHPGQILIQYNSADELAQATDRGEHSVQFDMPQLLRASTLFDGYE